MTKPGRHVALLVEDDLEMAAEVGELLESIGHDHVHAATRDDAEKLIADGRFCYALLDLEIKATQDSIRPRVEAGESLRKLLRGRYPRRSEAGEHLLQIIMVTGHSEIRYVVNAFQERVDDYIPKPIGENFKERIERALHKAGRENHELCAEIMRKARADAQNEPVQAPTTRISISGRQVAQRYEVRVNAERVTLPYGAFVLLLRLVEGRLGQPEGWVHKAELGAREDQGWKGVSRLKQELSKTPIEIENDGHGSYRLAMTIEIERVDTARLSAIDDVTITKLAAKIQQSHRE